MARWLTIDLERALSVNRGWETILCDHSKELIGPLGGTLVVKMSEAALAQLRNDLGPSPDG